MKILIITNREDDHARVVADALDKKGHVPIKWMTDEFLVNHKSMLRFSSTGEISATINNKESIINRDEIDVVWLRRPSYPRIPKNISVQDVNFIIDENRMNLRSLWFMLEKTATWINPLESNQQSNVKACQLLKATSAGMKIPETIMTNDRNEIIDFINKNEKTGTIYKTFLPGCWDEADNRFNCQTTEITAEMIPSQSIMKLTPGIYQEKVSKAFEIRATFFGDQYIAVRINNNLELDWRISSLASDFMISPIKLPLELEKQCLLLMEKLNIVFGCFDFIVTPSGDYIFLEVNEMGQFLWIEDILPELKLLDTFCEFLVSCSKQNKSKSNSLELLELDTISSSKSYLDAFEKDTKIQTKLSKYLAS